MRIKCLNVGKYYLHQGPRGLTSLQRPKLSTKYKHRKHNKTHTIDPSSTVEPAATGGVGTLLEGQGDGTRTTCDTADGPAQHQLCNRNTQ